MRKIPVFETVGHSYAFAFRKYFPVFGVIWLPLAILGALGYFLLTPLFGSLFHVIAQAVEHPGAKEFDPAVIAQLSKVQGYAGLFDLAELVLFPIVLVGITKEALGLRHGFRPVYLRFGTEEVLVLALFFVAVAAGFVIAIVTLIGGAIIGVVVALIASAVATAPVAVKAVLAALAVVGVLAGFVAVAYVLIRAAFLYIPIAVAERRFGIGRSWELMKGNVLRAFGVMALIVLPVFIIECVVIAIAAIPVILQIAAEAQKHRAAAVQSHLEAMGARMPGILAGLAAAFVLLSPLLFAIFYSPAAFAYRALVPAGGEGDAGTGHGDASAAA